MVGILEHVGRGLVNRRSVAGSGAARHAGKVSKPKVLSLTGRSDGAREDLGTIPTIAGAGRQTSAATRALSVHLSNELGGEIDAVAVPINSGTLRNVRNDIAVVTNDETRGNQREEQHLHPGDVDLTGMPATRSDHRSTPVSDLL
jgi:hypothetical protein